MEIDITSPQVQRLLRVSRAGEAVTDTSRRKLVQVAGDMDTGVLASTRLDSGKAEVLVYYRARDLWMTVDVYAVPGEKPRLHFLCPRCENALQIPGHKKDIDWDPLAANPLLSTILASPPADWDREDVAYLRARGARGRLSVEPFQCTWELPNSHELCRWRAAFDKNVAKDA